MAERTYTIFKRSFAGSDIKEFFKYLPYLCYCVRDYNNNCDLTIPREVSKVCAQPRGITGFLDGLNINQDIIINNRLYA